MRDAGRPPVEREVSPVERPPSEIAPGRCVPGGRSVPADELLELAQLLAEVVALAADLALCPYRLKVITDQARGHECVRRSLERLR